MYLYLLYVHLNSTIVENAYMNIDDWRIYLNVKKKLIIKQFILKNTGSLELKYDIDSKIGKFFSI